jgi:alkanesulfonate monooxygenase SsuD/methylene tetrahydromethanopterin reductase-like flavin-dependent oxidoreductase (luciferase family)
VFIAESDAEARKAGDAAYKVWSEHLTHLTRKHGKPDLLNVSPASPAAVTRLVAGSPATVTRELAQIVRESGINYLLLVFSFGDLAPERAMRSMDLFVAEVMPALRAGRA